MSPILKAILSMIILVVGFILLIVSIKMPNNILLSLSIILSLIGAFLSAVSLGEILKK